MNQLNYLFYRDKEQAFRRSTTDGYKVYTEDELKLGKGGDTDLCPFDCK